MKKWLSDHSMPIMIWGCVLIIFCGVISLTVIGILGIRENRNECGECMKAQCEECMDICEDNGW